MTISFFILNLVNTLAMVYGASKLSETKINFKNKKIYIVLIVVSLYSFFAYYLTKSVLRVAILFQLLNACYIYLFQSEKNGIYRMTCISIICWVLLTLSEVFVAIITYLFFALFSSAERLNYFTDFLGYLVLVIFLLIFHIKPFIKIMIKFINRISSSKSYNFLFIMFHMFLILITTLYLIYFDLSQILKFILLIIALFEYLYLITFLIVSHKNKEKIQRELDLMIEVSSQYEETITDIRTKNHENKNQLIVIKDLIGKDDKKAKKYIDNMVNTKYKDDNELIIKVTNIPAGGLKGLVYYKLLVMKSKKIYCYLNVDKNINKNVFENINSNLIQSFYKIVGVFLDNAIEAVVETKGKKKIISIEIYLESEFFILTVSNEYSNLIDLDKIGKQKVTSKGDGHGYGLQLVQEIVESNKEIIHETNIIGNLFVQKVGIKIKK